MNNIQFVSATTRSFSYSVERASRFDIDEVQRFQERMLLENEIIRKHVYPQDSAYRNRVLDENGSLYVARSHNGDIVGTLISACMSSDEEVMDAFRLKIYAGNILDNQNENVRMLSTAIVDPLYTNNGIWNSMVDAAIEDAKFSGAKTVVRGAVINNQRTVSKIMDKNFHITAYGKLKTLKQRCFLFSLNLENPEIVIKPEAFIRYSLDDIDTDFETYLDAGYIGTYINQEARMIGFSRSPFHQSNFQLLSDIDFSNSSAA